MNSTNQSENMNNNNDSTVKDRKRSLSLVSDVDEDQQGSSSKRVQVIAGGEDKKMKRVMANRRSAKESRERRKQLLTDLEGSVDILSKENSSLAAENAELRKQLAYLLPQARANMSLLSQAQSLQQASQRRFPTDLLGANAFRSSSLIKGLAQERALLDQQSLLRQLQF